MSNVKKTLEEVFAAMAKARTQSERTDAASAVLFGMKKTDASEHAVCVICRKPSVEFRDEISRREYRISGTCQVCQDETFGV